MQYKKGVTIYAPLLFSIYLFIIYISHVLFLDIYSTTYIDLLGDQG